MSIRLAVALSRGLALLVSIQLCGCATAALWTPPEPTEIPHVLFEGECTYLEEVRIDERATSVIRHGHSAANSGWEGGTLVALHRPVTETDLSSPSTLSTRTTTISLLNRPPFQLKGVRLDVLKSEADEGSQNGEQGLLTLAGSVSSLPTARWIPSSDAPPDWDALPESKSAEKTNVFFSAEEMRKLSLGVDFPASSAVVVDFASRLPDLLPDADPEPFGDSVGEPLFDLPRDPHVESQDVDDSPTISDDEILLRTSAGDYVILRRVYVPYLRYVHTLQTPGLPDGEPTWSWTYEQPHRVASHLFAGASQTSEQEGPTCSVRYREVELRENHFTTADYVWRPLVTPFAAAADVASSVAILFVIISADDDDDDNPW